MLEVEDTHRPSVAVSGEVEDTHRPAPAGESGFVGLLVDSAAVPAATNLVIFMDRLGVSDGVEVQAAQ